MLEAFLPTKRKNEKKVIAATKTVIQKFVDEGEEL